MKLSQWHNRKIKPVHIGVYQRRFSSGGNIFFSSGGNIFWYSLWNGKYWCSLFLYEEDAQLSENKSQFQKMPWRGIVK